jgi:Zn-dependent peptidase ImmA (M78 family)
VAELVEVKSELISWAVDRSGHAHELEDQLPKLRQWRAGSLAKLTFVELEKLSEKTHTPLGYFFLTEPPVEEMPIPDFRTVSDEQLEHTSLDLSETLYAMQMRQSWYANHQQSRGLVPLPFVGSAKINDPVEKVASSMREVLGLPESWASKIRTMEDAVSFLRERIEGIGVLIVINGVVGNNNNRVLNVDEFRGFVLSDEYAPLIFINGRDWKSAQVFTIFHELAHVWVNRSGISDLKELVPQDAVEKYCNQVAAEALVPASEVSTIWYSYEYSDPDFSRLAKHFKVNQIVVARRLLDLELINRKRFVEFYSSYSGADVAAKRDPGGHFYNNQIYKIGKRFMRSVARAANEGTLNFTDAYRLTGLSTKTFDKYLAHIGGVL